MQVKHLLNVNSFEIIWSSFLSIIMNKLLRNPALVRKSLSHLFWHLLLLFLSFFLATMELVIQICWCKVSGENGKKLLLETFLSYQKWIIPVDVFINFWLSRSVPLRRKWFLGEGKERKTISLQETQADQIS